LIKGGVEWKSPIKIERILPKSPGRMTIEFDSSYIKTFCFLFFLASKKRMNPSDIILKVKIEYIYI